MYINLYWDPNKMWRPSIKILTELYLLCTLINNNNWSFINPLGETLVDRQLHLKHQQFRVQITLTCAQRELGINPPTVGYMDHCPTSWATVTLTKPFIFRSHVWSWNIRIVTSKSIWKKNTDFPPPWTVLRLWAETASSTSATCN